MGGGFWARGEEVVARIVVGWLGGAGGSGVMQLSGQMGCCFYPSMFENAKSLAGL